jgi:hypothetical protein
MNWKSAMNRTVGSVKIKDLRSYASAHIGYGDYSSPIDCFYCHSQKLTKAAAVVLPEHDVLGPLLMVGLISATENYFRGIFALMLNTCPLSRRNAADHPVALGAVLWHDLSKQSKGAFEHMSFASAKSVKKNSNNILGYSIGDKSPVGTILAEYESICQLRHGAVHAGAELPGKNAIALGMTKTPGVVAVNVGISQLQEVLDICTTLVCQFNSSLFAEMVKRWAEDWRRLPSWDSDGADASFMALWNSFYSLIDNERNYLPSKTMTASDYKAQVEADFGV